MWDWLLEQVPEHTPAGPSFCPRLRPLGSSPSTVGHSSSYGRVVRFGEGGGWKTLRGLSSNIRPPAHSLKDHA